MESTLAKIMGSLRHRQGEFSFSAGEREELCAAEEEWCAFAAFFCAPVKFWWSSAAGAGTDKPLFLSAEGGASGERLSGEFAEIR
ncbi:hypothetical protein AYX07_01075 [Thermoactinomyces sp. AS95]|nr:hypothetical protein JS81_04295 [Thermoactinomyces sp. Gus2-1]KYQ87328.1 hypothetical protein AYX07_01075 [Thermoactinomyces sp. AS95]